MDRLLFADDIAERYRVTKRKALEMMQAMPTINLGTDKRRKLAVPEAALEAWERERMEIRAGYQRKGQRPRMRVIRPTGTDGLVCPKRPKR
jgi:hypothetical protein